MLGTSTLNVFPDSYIVKHAMGITRPAATKVRRLAPAALALIATRFKQLGEPARLALLHALMAGEMHVTELVGATGLSQANASKHLAQLAAAGFVSRRKDGLFTRYAIADPIVFQLCDLMCNAIARQLGRDLDGVR
jgi:ArsR family transcriptional regulator